MPMTLTVLEAHVVRGASRLCNPPMKKPLRHATRGSERPQMGHSPRRSESPSDCLSLLVVPTRGVTREARDTGHRHGGERGRHQAGGAEPSGEDGLAHGEQKLGLPIMIE